jgi:hypothetical protein
MRRRHAAKACLRFVQPPEPAQEQRGVEQGAYVIRALPDRGSQGGQRFLIPSVGFERLCKAHPSFGESPTHAKRLAKCGLRSRDLVKPEVGKRQVVMRLRERRVEANRLGKLGRGSIRFTLAKQRNAEVHARRR